MASPRHAPGPTTVLLVRHGTTPTTGKILPGRAPGLHLADAGVRQAEAAATAIGELSGVRAVYASPMERTRETAQPIARACGVRVRRREGLNECDFGDWTGRRLATLSRRKEWQTVQRAPSLFRFPNGESFVEMQARITSEIGALCAAHPGETIVAVSHADPIKAAAASALGTPLDLFQRIVIAPCSVTVIRYGSLGPVVVCVSAAASTLSSTLTG